jgi:hypothetical protein
MRAGFVWVGYSPNLRSAAAKIKCDRHWPMFDRLPIPNWTRGHLTLLGDAAHPMLQYIAQGPVRHWKTRCAWVTTWRDIRTIRRRHLRRIRNRGYSVQHVYRGPRVSSGS